MGPGDPKSSIFFLLLAHPKLIRWRFGQSQNRFFFFSKFFSIVFYKLSKTLPQKIIASNKRKPSTESRKPNSAWRGGRGLVEMLKTCTSYILDTELHNTMWLSYQSSHTNALHITFSMKYNFHYLYMSVWVKEMLFGPQILRGSDDTVCPCIIKWLLSIGQL